MSIVWTADQEELRKVVRQFCDHRSTEDDVRAAMASESGFDREVWTQMGQQIGLQGIAIDEAHGGAGMGQLELTLVAEELGRSLLCSPFLGTVALSAAVVEESGDEAVGKRLLPAIAAGDLVVALAYQGTRPTGRELDPPVLASHSAQGWTLRGAASFVLDGASADQLLVLAHDGDDLALFLLDPRTEGVSRRPLPTVDQTRRFAEVHLEGCAAELVESTRDPRVVLARALDRAGTTLAAEQVGGAQRMLDMSVAYAQLRHQFGRPIGSFQAVKHRCADMLLAVEGARSAAYHAALCLATDSPDAPVAAAVAQATATEAYLDVTAAAIQVHGGVGFTWEHPAHLYFKRALSSEHLFGDAAAHREALVQMLEDQMLEDAEPTGAVS